MIRAFGLMARFWNDAVVLKACQALNEIDEMKRDPRLHGLSSEHHHALILVRRLRRRRGRWTEQDGLRLERRFASELDPHFRVEEEALLPAIRLAGSAALADRTLEDHLHLRNRVKAAGRGDGSAVEDFASRLYEHIRFEERELFPACERLGADVLNSVMRRSSKKGRSC